MEKENRRFKPTELGEIVVNILQEFFGDIVDVDFTADMEEKLDKIEAGEEEWKRYYKYFISHLSKNWN